MQRSLPFLLLSCLGVVSAVLQNITVDDTSPDVLYGGKTFQCNADNACQGVDASLEQLYNESTTFTEGSITFSFSGVAYYATIDVLFGEASVIIDGGPGTSYSSLDAAGNFTIRHNISEEGLPSGTHSLLMLPSPQSNTVLGFDSLTYTVSLPDPPKTKSHAGAIAGGVVGGLAVLFGLLFAALYSHRRKLILRRNQRKSAVLQSMNIGRRNFGQNVDVKDPVPAI
ncbi:hypothetical protein FB45DRAFT_1064050 [Roridomyces roridus]|uniref:Uncharacterized protein n=1 Tax=Roridomyces roridus TaxID=1738132 RepID=A0AAD7BB92_9AGAR|nr:hypothetical protein FB45DRAFT_1064050 [Roridomyces roridus]